MSFEAFPLRDDEQRSAVLRLWHDNFGDQRIRTAIEPRWRWVTDGNPAGPVKLCVVVHRETGAVVGSGGALPRLLRIGGAPARGAVLCDFVVDKEFRVAGAALTLQRKLAEICFAESIEVLYGFPNPGAFPILARVGYKALGTATMMVRPVRSRVHLRQRMSPVVAGAASFFVDRLLHAHDLQLVMRRTRRDLADAQLTSADESFAALWDELSARPGVLPERTPQHLNWRYTRHPIEPHTFFSLTDKATGRLRGYIVFVAHAGKVNVLDAVWASPDVLPALFVRFIWRMRSLGHASISVCHAGDPGVARTLRKMAFISSKVQRNFVCKVAPGRVNDLGPVANDLAQWSVFDGELDI